MNRAATNDRSVQPAVQVGTYLFDFATHTEWRNKAKSWFANCGVPLRDTICIDAAGRICAIGEHFMTARDEGTYPIQVWTIRHDIEVRD